MYILANMWFTKLIKQFFFWIDKIVYNFISSIYDLMITIARTSVLTQADIADMADRIYKLLAIFMIFKVTLSLITYVVNPDDFSDKSKGVSKLGTNIIISLAMLILTPYIFNYAYQFQTIILEDNSLATLIFGGSDCEGETSFFNTAGDDMAYITMSAFITPNYTLANLHECAVLVEKKANTNNDSCAEDFVKFNQNCSGLDAEFNDLNIDGSLMSLTKDNPNFSEQTLKNYIGGVENNSLGLLFRQDLVLATDADNEEFIMDYKFIFSTVVGVVIILLLISFCMDVAVRSIKLAFLQLVAPIPILSFVDPKSGKDGLFKKWYEMCFKTYLSLFIRLIALYFAVYIISKVADMKMVDIVDGSYQTNALVAIFIIIGALMFAKQLPKILEGLGIKLDSGSFTLNPLRKMEKEALGGKILKKPNDMLAKGAKAVALSPFTGASLGARKLMAGVDSASHGKGFWNGTKNVKGKMAQAKDKFIEKNLPHTAKSLKDKKEGRDEVALMHSKWSKGEAIYKRMAKKRYNDGSLDGINEQAYREAGFKGQFLESKKTLDVETEKQKILRNLNSAAATNPEGLKGAINGLIANEKEKKNLEKYFGTGYEAKLKQMSNSSFAKELDTQDKKVAGLEKVHESMRKQNQDQAAIEDQLKFVKYNKIDPTDTSRHSILEQSSSSSSSDGGNSSSSNNGGGSNSSSDGGNSSSPNNGGGSNSSNDGGGSSPSNNGGGSNSSSDVGSSSSSNDGGGSNSSQQNPNDAAAQERERMKREIDAQVEELEKRIKNINETFEARKKVYEPRIKSLEELLERYKDQRKNAPDTASRDAIDKDIDQAIANLDREKANLKRIEEEKEKQIEILKKQIETLKSGV